MFSIDPAALADAMSVDPALGAGIGAAVAVAAVIAYVLLRKPAAKPEEPSAPATEAPGYTKREKQAINVAKAKVPAPKEKPSELSTNKFAPKLDEKALKADAAARNAEEEALRLAAARKRAEEEARKAEEEARRLDEAAKHLAGQPQKPSPEAATNAPEAGVALVGDDLEALEADRKKREELERQREEKRRIAEEAKRAAEAAKQAEESAKAKAKEARARAKEEIERAKSVLEGVKKTREVGFVARLGELFRSKKQLSKDLMEQVEEVLFLADIGPTTSPKLMATIEKELSRAELSDPQAVFGALRQKSLEILTSVPGGPFDFSRAKGDPFVIMVIGVNGAGKTTTIGKLASRFVAEDKTVILAAGDTFRAAAAEQLEVWGERTACEVVKGKEGSDSAAVIYKGVTRACEVGAEVVIADTAGRLHTKSNLMEELKKAKKVIGKVLAGAPHEVLLVLDATMGQNAIAQAKQFTQDLDVTGIILTKLDGTAKGGVILGICDDLGLPIRYIGVGEKVGDLRPFDPLEFVDALFASVK